MCRADLVQGIIAGGEPALSRATETTEDDPAIGVRDLLAHGFRTGDVLCGIAASGRTPYVLGAIDEANRYGRADDRHQLHAGFGTGRRAEIAITPLPGPEIIAGSTRLKAGTATKLVLNMLTTGSFHPHGICVGQSDGERAAEEFEAAGPLEENHCEPRRGVVRRGGTYAGSSG